MISERAGLVMNPDAKVQVRGVQVGKVASFEDLPDGGAALHLAMDPSRLSAIPANALDLDLVGVWVHSEDKVGEDAGELAGGEPMGLAATNDADALIALRPDCVVYAASGPERDAGAVPDYVRLLEAGINVVSTTSTSLVYPPA